MNKHVIIRNIERAESSIIDRLGAAHDNAAAAGYAGAKFPWDKPTSV